MKRFLLFAIITMPIGALSAAGAQESEADFASRCSAPGVLRCIGFDNETSDIVRGDNLHPDGSGNYRAGLDASVKTSGGGSLRFDLPPPPHSGANLAGSWSPTSNDGLGQLFGQGSTFYVQFRQRFSSEMLNNTWDTPGFKTVIFHQNQTTCGGIELATWNYYNSNIITMYTNCGSVHAWTTLDGSRHTESPPLLLQQGDFPCEYGQTSANTCLYIPANEWLTFYYKISVGTWDQPNSMIEAWITREGSSTYQQFIRAPQMPISCNANSCGSSEGQSEGFNNLTFTPYMTGLSGNSGRSGVTAKTWIDELIVSTQPIAAPDSGPRPRSPTNLTPSPP